MVVPSLDADDHHAMGTSTPVSSIQHYSSKLLRSSHAFGTVVKLPTIAAPRDSVYAGDQAPLQFMDRLRCCIMCIAQSS